MVSMQQNPKALVKEIRRQKLRKFSTKEKIRIVAQTADQPPTLT